MNDEASVWLQYAQQAVEKALKAILVRRNMPLKRTHSIRDLNRDLQMDRLETGLAEEDCDLLDSIYVSSKYPLDSVLPHSPPDLVTSQRCVELARQAVMLAKNVTET